MTSAIDQDLAVAKTIYDPCPPGFKVPNRNAFTGFTTTGTTASSSDQFNVSGSFTAGWDFYTNPSSAAAGTIFFPASGMRSLGNGALLNVTTYGHYWSAAPSTYNNPTGRSLSFCSSNVKPANSGDRRGHAFAVRPVQE